MPNLFSLENRTALITGSGSGIGLALAGGLAEHGATVVLNGRTAAKVEAAAQFLRQRGHKVHVSLFDVTDRHAVEAGVADVEAQVGPIDILVNNAGLQHRAPLHEFPDERWDALLATNISGVFFASRAVAQGMIARGRGKIISIASVTSELARTSIAPYGATKGAVRNLTRGMCADWARFGIQANALAPGYFRTELNQALVDDPAFSEWLEKRTPAGRWGEVEELVGAAVFLASDASNFVNGQTIYVDGGITASV